MILYIYFSLESPPANNIVETEDKKDDGLWNDENNGDADEEESKAFYNKAKSFFDNISCEAVERSKGWENLVIIT